MRQLLVLLCILLAPSAYAQIPTPTPNAATCAILLTSGAGDITQNTHIGLSTNWQAAQTDDGLTSYVTNVSFAEQQDLYAMADPTPNPSPIVSVSVIATSRAQFVGGQVNRILKVEGNLFLSGYTGVDTHSWHVNVGTWYLNPNTSVAWAWADIPALQAGIIQRTLGGTDSIRTTQVFMEVCWAVNTPTPTNTRTPTPTPTETPRSCCVIHSDPGCDDATCQDSICNGGGGFFADPYCCTTAWDQTCVFKVDARTTAVCACSDESAIDNILTADQCCDCVAYAGDFACRADPGYVCLPVCTLVDNASCAVDSPGGCATFTPTPTTPPNPTYVCQDNTPTLVPFTPTPTYTPQVVVPGTCCECPFSPICASDPGTLCPSLPDCVLIPAAECLHGFACTRFTPTPTPIPCNVSFRNGICWVTASTESATTITVVSQGGYTGTAGKLCLTALSLEGTDAGTEVTITDAGVNTIYGVQRGTNNHKYKYKASGDLVGTCITGPITLTQAVPGTARVTLGYIVVP